MSRLPVCLMLCGSGRGPSCYSCSIRGSGRNRFWRAIGGWPNAITASPSMTFSGVAATTCLLPSHLQPFSSFQTSRGTILCRFFPTRRGRQGKRLLASPRPWLPLTSCCLVGTILSTCAMRWALRTRNTSLALRLICHFFESSVHQTALQQSKRACSAHEWRQAPCRR